LNKTNLFSNTNVSSNRIIYTPSEFARQSLIHLQEVGTLTAVKPHVSSRVGLDSYLFFVVTDGMGYVETHGERIWAKKGDCVFLNCRDRYAQCSGEELWTLKWAHFSGPTMESIYEKYISRGGKAVFSSARTTEYIRLLDEIYSLAESEYYTRDMYLTEKLTSLLTIIMEESWNSKAAGSEWQEKKAGRNGSRRGKLESSGGNLNSEAQMARIKKYIEDHYQESIKLEKLSEVFFINKYYLERIFKEKYGTTINNYVNYQRITKAKNLLRFSQLSIEQIGEEVGIDDANYFIRVFKKMEGTTPGKYRKDWGV